jgi:hypothetical protein
MKINIICGLFYCYQFIHSCHEVMTEWLLRTGDLWSGFDNHQGQNILFILLWPLLVLLLLFVLIFFFFFFSFSCARCIFKHWAGVHKK